MSSKHECPHGRVIGGPGPLANVAWAGGVSTCGCCQQHYGYIDSASYNDEGLIRSLTADKTLCDACGGKITEYLHPDYELIELASYYTSLRKKGAPLSIHEIKTLEAIEKHREMRKKERDAAK